MPSFEAFYDWDATKLERLKALIYWTSLMPTPSLSVSRIAKSRKATRVAPRGAAKTAKQSASASKRLSGSTCCTNSGYDQCALDGGFFAIC
jgi:hypothetical protein